MGTAGRPVLRGSVTVGRPGRDRTEAVYRCIEFLDELGEGRPVGPRETYCYRNEICFGKVS